jgi:DNA invertase Pin-like site-specific DNA recombinase
MNTAFVAYTRVSTERQGASGLGLAAQTAAVEQYVAGKGVVVASFVEVESGANSARPELAKALAAAKRMKAVLVIAKLDRLARNVAFIANLMESGVNFVAVDNPTATKLTIHILAAVAEAEREAISARTVAALQAARERGTVLGGRRENGHVLGAADFAKSAARRRDDAREAYADIVPVVCDLRAQGDSLAVIARKLDAAGYRTRNGSSWSSMQVSRVLALAEAA